ncbi:MAG: hypothetical protein ACYS91_15245 [Planctomycetota bacterium]
MNVNKVLTKVYIKGTLGQLGKTNPIQTQFKANQTQLKPIKRQNKPNTNPKQTQSKPKQPTAFSHCLLLKTAYNVHPWCFLSLQRGLRVSK